MAPTINVTVRMAIVSAEKVQLKPRKVIKAKKMLRTNVAFMVAAPYSWENVIEEFAFLFFAAKMSDEITSEAFEQYGVMRQET